MASVEVILYRAWKNHGEGAEGLKVMCSSSNDEGQTWSSPQEVTGAQSNYGPALCTDSGGNVYLAWVSLADGIQVCPFDNFASVSSIPGSSSDRPALGIEMFPATGTPSHDDPFGNGPSSGLAVAWKNGTEQDILLSHSDDDGKTWTSGATVTGHTTCGPALAVTSGTLYCAWKGENVGTDDPGMYMSTTTDGLNWTPEHPIPGETTHGPALTSGPPGNRIHRAWKGAQGDSSMWISSTADGVNWTPQVEITGATSHGPALAGTNVTLYRLWKGRDDPSFGGDDYSLWFSTSNDGNTWTPQATLEGLTDDAPALAVVVSEIPG